MAMHNPPHPGEFITEVYLKPNNLSGRELASKLGVASFNSESHPYRRRQHQPRNGAAAFQGAWPLSESWLACNITTTCGKRSSA